MRWPIRSAASSARALPGAGHRRGRAFPGGIKAMAEWFPKKERVATSFNAGTNIGHRRRPDHPGYCAMGLAGGLHHRRAALAAYLAAVHRTPRQQAPLAAELACTAPSRARSADKVETVALDPPARRPRDLGRHAALFLIDPTRMFLRPPDFRLPRLDLKTWSPIASSPARWAAWAAWLALLAVHPDAAGASTGRKRPPQASAPCWPRRWPSRPSSTTSGSPWRSSGASPHTRASRPPRGLPGMSSSGAVGFPSGIGGMIGAIGAWLRPSTRASCST